MIKECISKDWFLRTQFKNDYEKVDLPNDYAISIPRNKHTSGGAGNGYYVGGIGKYVKYLKNETADTDENSHIILDVDGAYMCAEVSLNENLLTMHPYGYTPFLVDLTEKLRKGRTNKLEIKTNAMEPSTRWYSGAGLYRDVFLWHGGEVRIEPRDVFVTTKTATFDEAEISIRYLVSADRNSEVVINAKVTDAEGMKAAIGSASVSASTGIKTAVTLNLKIASPKLWDTENPNLYVLDTEVIADGKKTDTDRTTFGIRTVSADVENGLLLNGKSLKLRGGCIHHDHGVLGAAAFPAAEERKLSRLKEAGFNAVRIAHNPPSLALLEVCDRIGMIVMDEAFDMWNKGKNNCDYHLWFADRWAEDIADMVLRDRNHPCVFSYSIGNEIAERDGNSDGAKWSKLLSDEVRKYDTTRFVTSAINKMWIPREDIDSEEYKSDALLGYDDIGEGQISSSWDKRTKEFAEPLDIVGYNYLYFRYENDRELYPKRVIWGSETQVLNFYKSWHAVMRNSHVLGDFTWTAYDNMGEVGGGRTLWERDGIIKGLTSAAYPWRNCYQGDLDLCGFRRPQSFFREATWIGGIEPRIFTTHPEHYGEGFSGTGWHWYDVNDTWTFEDKYIGKPVKVEVYTGDSADAAVFSLNGREVGRAIPSEGIATIDVPYEKGTLSVSAVKDGKPWGHSSLHTVGKPSKITVTPEKDALNADNRDLCYFDITVADISGDRVPDAESSLTCVVEGGSLMGIFSGDPSNDDMFTSNTAHAFYGRAVAIVRTDKMGKVRVTVVSDGLTVGQAEVTAN